MVSENEVVRKVGEITLPGLGLSLKKLNLVKETQISGGSIKLTLASAGLNEARRVWLSDRIKTDIEQMPGTEKLEIEFKDYKTTELNQVSNIIAVISGKGGVGKSVVSSLLAVSLNRQGYSTGILDADLTGPSIPRMFGIDTRPEGTESAILPVLSRAGTEVMSLNLILEHEDEAVIWRGPVITQVIRQFWEGVLWGKLDYLIIDLPPGTADAPLTVMQQLPVKGIVIVFTPQALTGMIVRKTVKMAQKMKKPIVGVVENMSYLYVPELKKKMEIFGKSKADQMAQSAGAPLLAQLPLDPQLVALCDEGRIEEYQSDLVEKLGEELVKAMGTQERKDISFE
jgi:Mrp family chromosome partitioning ATPase